MGATTTRNVIAASYDSWAAPSCSNFSATFSGDLANGRHDTNDRRNVHVWLYDNWPPELGGSSVIGVTTPVWQVGGNIFDADIQYNGFNFIWTTNYQGACSGNRCQAHAQSILTHEIGHQLGLNHSNSSSATMFASYPGGTGQASLSQDDIGGVCALYPTGQAQCASSQECNQGEACISGSCVAQQPNQGDFGDDCNDSSECTSQICVGDPSTPGGVCTSDGTGGQPCPPGFPCTPIQGGSVCLQDPNAPMGGSIGDPCASGQDCAEGLCVGDPNTPEGVCTRACSTTDNVQTCPDNWSCESLGSGGEACIQGTTPGGNGQFGDPCMRGADCATGLCVGDPNTAVGVCTEAGPRAPAPAARPTRPASRSTAGPGPASPDLPPRPAWASPAPPTAIASRASAAPRRLGRSALHPALRGERGLRRQPDLRAALRRGPRLPGRRRASSSPEDGGPTGEDGGNPPPPPPERDSGVPTVDMGGIIGFKPPMTGGGGGGCAVAADQSAAGWMLFAFCTLGGLLLLRRRR